MIGLKFNSALVLSETTRVNRLQPRFLCLCDCGKTFESDGRHLRSGGTKSCGCIGRENARKASTTHGMSKTKEFNVWHSMKSRCNNPNVKEYPFYGGRGIKVCERWFNSFENFIADMGLCPSGYSIERIDVNGDYSPENCKWIPRNDQSKNLRSNRVLTVNGVSKIMSEWAKDNGLTSQHIYTRLKRGWSVEEAVMTKPNQPRYLHAPP